MHEYSLFLNVLFHLENLLKDYKKAQLKKIIFSVGEFSGIDLEYLRQVIETFKKNTLLEKPEIFFEIEKLTIQCFNCGSVTEPENKGTQCPYCKSLETKIVGGMDFIIKRVEIEY